MTLSELADAWNGLANVALGRGATPAVGPALAARVRGEYEAWRLWYADAGALDDIFSSVSASDWVERYRALAADVQRELPGQYLPTLLPTPLERASSAARSTGSGLLTAGIFIVGLAAGAYVWSRR